MYTINSRMVKVNLEKKNYRVNSKRSKIKKGKKRRSGWWTLRADSQRNAAIRSWRASSTVLGKSFLELLGPPFFSITALVASLLKIIEMAFCDATFLFISSFLSLDSLSFSLTMSILLLSPSLSVTVSAVLRLFSNGLSGLEFGLFRLGTGFELGRGWNAGGKGLFGPDMDAIGLLTRVHREEVEWVFTVLVMTKIFWGGYWKQKTKLQFPPS